ncbi:MAG: zinc-binding dehydrogenase, partial [Chloroflexi bacterium]|nr:zinc-binding dehydrogenase [Chloroflexota bacterium]
GYYQRRGSPLVEQWMDAILKLYDGGRIRPVIYRAYPLREAAQALAALATRESFGKVVLLP